MQLMSHSPTIPFSLGAFLSMISKNHINVKPSHCYTGFKKGVLEVIHKEVFNFNCPVHGIIIWYFNVHRWRILFSKQEPAHPSYSIPSYGYHNCQVRSHVREQYWEPARVKSNCQNWPINGSKFDVCSRITSSSSVRRSNNLFAISCLQ